MQTTIAPKIMKALALKESICQKKYSIKITLPVAFLFSNIPPIFLIDPKLRNRIVLLENGLIRADRLHNQFSICANAILKTEGNSVLYAG